MTNKRRRERRAQRDRDTQSTQRTLMIVGGALVVLVVAVLIISNSAAQGTANSGVVTTVNPDQYPGTDPCIAFPTYAPNMTEAPLVTIDTTKDYAAWIVTAKGTIKVNLFAADAPATVNNFMFLACNHFYDGLTFHRVIPGFVAQGGDPKGDSTGDPGYSIPDEFTLSTRVFDKPGLLSMAHSSLPDSAGSQFFITLADTESTQGLSGGFTIFGEVADDASMQVALSITPRDPDDPSTAENTPDVMQGIVVKQVN